jgi:quinol monooxygenase YgiN
MGKVMFTISYDINPEKRDEFLALTVRMKQHLAQKNGKSYSIYEHKGKKNSFSEVFIFSSMEEYDQLEDQDEQMGQFVQELEQLMVNGKMKYSTLIELQ